MIRTTQRKRIAAPGERQHRRAIRTGLKWGILALAVGVIGCGEGSPENAETAGDDSNENPPMRVAPAQEDDGSMTIAELRRKLGANENAQFRKAAGEIRLVSLFQSGVTDITPLKGLPLQKLDLTGCPISDLTPLEGMPLQELYLESTEVSDISPLEGLPLTILRMEHTDVSDISPLEGMGLKQLNLFDTKVTDIEVVRTMPLDTLWLTDTQIASLGALEGKHLESLDIQNTPIDDLSVLKDMTSLKRLNIAGSAVTDLTPLKNLQLNRLIFTPEKIKTGLKIARNMPSLQTLGTSFENLTPAAQFWQKYDAGEL